MADVEKYRKGLHLVPEHMRDSILMWIETPVAPRMLGSFLYAVLCNDLVGAFACADDENARGMRGWVEYLTNYAPRGCYGSVEAVKAWHASGGLRRA